MSVARHVAAAALEQPESASERRLWAAEVGRAEQMVWTAAEGIEVLLEAGTASGRVPEEAAQVLAARREAAESVGGGRVPGGDRDGRRVLGLP